MNRRSKNAYPHNWPEIARRVKHEAGWKCTRCSQPHDPKAGYTLTVHHLDLNPANCAWWNLVALCQRCHLVIQNKVIMERAYMFQHSPWFQPYVAGFYASLQGLPTDREYIDANLDQLLSFPLKANPC